MKVGFCLDCGQRLVLRRNIARSVRRHFKNAHPRLSYEQSAIEMKPAGRTRIPTTRTSLLFFGKKN